MKYDLLVLDDPAPDVRSPFDLRTGDAADAWAATAMQKRPWREEFFQVIVEEVNQLQLNNLNILELGSGPGFLAARVLQNVKVAKYVALDFSPAMHQLARGRLGALADSVTFLEADFKRPDWTTGLPAFDAILSVQAIHELRHKRHAPELYRSIKPLLREGGKFLMCDHFVGDGGMTDAELYMTVREHADALQAGGFTRVENRLQKGGLVLFLAA